MHISKGITLSVDQLWEIIISVHYFWRWKLVKLFLETLQTPSKLQKIAQQVKELVFHAVMLGSTSSTAYDFSNISV